MKENMTLPLQLKKQTQDHLTQCEAYRPLLIVCGLGS